MPRESRPRYQFGPFCLDLAEQQLRQDGHVLPVTPKVFDVLRVLVQNSGHLVEKERLLADVWPDSVVEEGAVNRSVSILRKTLGDSEQSYIETVPKRGYRFIARVTELDGFDPSNEAARRTTVTVIPESFRSHTALWVLAATGALFITGALAVVGRPDRETGEATTTRSTASGPAHRQVTFTGGERAPAISPDGRRIANVSFHAPDRKLVVKELAGGPPLTIFT